MKRGPPTISGNTCHEPLSSVFCPGVALHSGWVTHHPTVCQWVFPGCQEDVPKHRPDTAMHLSLHTILFYNVAAMLSKGCSGSIRTYVTVTVTVTLLRHCVSPPPLFRPRALHA